MKIGESFKLHLRSKFSSLQIFTWVVDIIVCRKQGKLIFVLFEGVLSVYSSKWISCVSSSTFIKRQMHLNHFVMHYVLMKTKLAQCRLSLLLIIFCGQREHRATVNVAIICVKLEFFMCRRFRWWHFFPLRIELNETLSNSWLWLECGGRQWSR